LPYPRPSGVLTLTTDFGLDDHYVGVMKGVIRSIHPDAHVIDLTHGVRSHSVEQGAFFLLDSYRYFPEGTVHVVVVDPGVGSWRRPLAAFCDGRYFIAPDNGVLSYVFEGRKAEAVEIDADRYGLKPMSRTFHGRDLFSPSGAWLASGVPFGEMGRRIDDWFRLPSIEPGRTPENGWTGRVLNVDKFGNIVTNFRPETVAKPFRLTVGELQTSRRVDAYADVRRGETFLIVGSAGFVEVSVREGSAAERAGVGTGDKVELEVL